MAGIATLSAASLHRHRMAETLLSSLEDPRDEVALAAAAGLGRLRSERAAPALRRWLASAHPDRSLSARQALLAITGRDPPAARTTSVD